MPCGLPKSADTMVSGPQAINFALGSSARRKGRDDLKVIRAIESKRGMMIYSWWVFPAVHRSVVKNFWNACASLFAIDTYYRRRWRQAPCSSIFTGQSTSNHIMYHPLAPSVFFSRLSGMAETHCWSIHSMCFHDNSAYINVRTDQALQRSWQIV
jgi:hypothetical protein